MFFPRRGPIYSASLPLATEQLQFRGLPRYRSKTCSMNFEAWEQGMSLTLCTGRFLDDG